MVALGAEWHLGQRWRAGLEVQQVDAELRRHYGSGNFDRSGSMRNMAVSVRADF